MRMLLSAGKILDSCKDGIYCVTTLYCNCSNRTKGAAKDVLLIITLFRFVFLDGVYTSAVINYAIQSELNISLLRAVCMKVMNKGYSNFDAAIQVCSYNNLGINKENYGFH